MKEPATYALLPAALILGLMLGGRSVAEEGEAPDEIPVVVHAQVDDQDVQTLGRWRLRLDFEVQEDIRRPYRIELRLTRRSETLLDLDHAPKPPTPAWRKGDRIRYEVPIPVPTDTGLEPGTALDLTLGFHDPEQGGLVKPRTEEGLWGRKLPIAKLELPTPPDADQPEHIEAVVLRAQALAAEGRKPDAWSALELGIRQARTDSAKRRYRDAILALEPFEDAPLSILEQDIVKRRIGDERRRWLRDRSSHFYRQGKLYAALRLLEEVGGTLSEDVDGAVIGALQEAKRTQRDIQEIRLRILKAFPEEDKQAARTAIEEVTDPKKLLQQAAAWTKARRYGAARIVLRHLSLASERETATAARARIEKLDATWLAATPLDQAEAVEAVKNHPSFERLATSTSQRFVFIGPKTLVDTIPPSSRLRFDLAYVFLTDLFGRKPNPSGDRITVFFKELWDFGGGQGGGKRIDIGRADPTRRATRVDTGLFYHELTHCVDDTNPIHVGWREGLADFGAVYAYESLGQKEGMYHGLKRSLEAFRKDYLARDIPYWRIQQYAVSAGFFLHFVDAYAKAPDGHDWTPYRRFFRAYRRAPVKDGREPTLVRPFARYLAEAFGPKAFDDLIRFRFPLEETDRGILEREVEAFRRGEHRARMYEEEFKTHPNSPLPRGLAMRTLLERSRRGRDADDVRRNARETLGILHDWHVIGPFKSPGADPRAAVFPPEHEIDFQKEYTSGLNTCRWRRTEPQGVVSVEPRGWVSFNFSYNDNTATYALTHVTVTEDQLAHVHVRADDDIALWVNGRRIEDYVSRRETSSQIFWRGRVAKAPDQQRFAVRLVKGRNPILLKVKNRFGATGFVLAVSKPDGSPIPGLEADLAPPEATPPPAEKRAWKDVTKHVFRGKSFGRRIEKEIGTWKVVNKRLVGQAKDKQVPWRKHTVRPGFPKDAPSNLFWFPAKHTEDLTDFRLRLDLVPPGKKQPKLVVTFQGEGGEDVLAGWTLILHTKNGKVRARLERYEMLVYQTAPIARGPEEVLPLLLELVDDALTVTLGGKPLFEGISVRRIPNRHRIGVATFGPALGIQAFELERPK